jgi:hypothetical protein
VSARSIAEDAEQSDTSRDYRKLTTTKIGNFVWRLLSLNPAVPLFVNVGWCASFLPPLRQGTITQPSLSSPMDADYLLHKILRRFASWAVYSFFTEVRVIGGENVPANGPIIVYVVFIVSSHVDDAIGYPI